MNPHMPPDDASTPTGLLVSVVVPTYRRPDMLARCLDALCAQNLPAHAFEIIVADDGPDAATLDAVASFATTDHPRVHYVPVIGTQGPAGARNAGWRHARAAIVAFTDDDTIPDPDWLKAGIARFSYGADAVTGRVVMPIPDPPTDYELDASGLARAEFVTANCFVRRDRLLATGGFDERYTAAWREDSDLHFALLEQGARIVPAPDAIVVHPVRPAPSGISLRQQRKVMFDALLYKKWPRLYRERIRPRPPWLYFLIVASLIAALAALLTGHYAAAATGVAVWAAGTLWFCWRRLEHTAHTPRHIAEMLATSALIPWLSVYWRLAGALRFRVGFL